MLLGNKQNISVHKSFHFSIAKKISDSMSLKRRILESDETENAVKKHCSLHKLKIRGTVWKLCVIERFADYESTLTDLRSGMTWTTVDAKTNNGADRAKYLCKLKGEKIASFVGILLLHSLQNNYEEERLLWISRALASNPRLQTTLAPQAISAGLALFPHIFVLLAHSYNHKSFALLGRRLKERRGFFRPIFHDLGLDSIPACEADSESLNVKQHCDNVLSHSHEIWNSLEAKKQ